MKTKFVKKYEELFNAYTTELAESDRLSKTDALNSTRYHHRAMDNLARATELFKRLAYSLPKEKMVEIHSLLEEKFIPLYGGAEKYRDVYLKSVVIPPKYPTEEARKFHFFYDTPNMALNSGIVRDVIAEAVQYLDDETLGKMVEEIDSYHTDWVVNTKVEFFRERVEELKIRNAQNIKDENRLNELNNELELVAKTVITSTRRYSTTHGDAYDAVYRRKAEDRIDELNEKALSTSEFEHLQKYFSKRRDGRYGGCRDIADAHIGDTAMADTFTADNVKFVVPEKTKASIRKVFDYMKANNMLSNVKDGNEDKHKLYAFTPIYEAHVRLRDAIETEDVQTIREAREQYQLEVDRMQNLYDLIREEFNPGFEMMVGNINSYREGVVPNQFKNDLVLNALVSGFYNLNSALTQTGKDIEELLENPGKTFMEVIKGFADREMANTVMKNKSIAEAIKLMTLGTATEGYPGLGLGRNMEFLQAITYGTDAFEANSLSYMLISSYTSYVGNVVYLGDALTPMDYLKTKEVESLANILLVNEEDRDYNKLRAIDSLAVDGTRRIPPFDAMKYLTSHVVDVEAFVDRVKSTVTELYAEKHFQRNPNATRATAIADTIRAAQFATYQFLAVHPTPVEGGTPEQWNALNDIMTKPEQVFENQIDDKILEALNKREPKHITIEREGKVKFDAARIEARDAEKAYAKRIGDLQKELNRISKALSGAGGDKANELRDRQIQLEERLRELPKLEQARLDKAYTDGKLPKDYYEQRKRDVQSGAHLNKTPFGASEYPKFKSFSGRYKTELKNGELSQEDVQNLYERMMENARYEEKMFFLVASETYPKPTLEAEEIAIVPERESIVVESVIDKKTDAVSEKIEKSLPELDKVKTEDQLKI